MELLIITRLAIACFTAVFGNAFSKWFLNTKAGAWVQVKVNKVSESAKKAIEKAGGTIYIITNRPENEEASVPSKSSEKVTKQ